MRFRSTQIAFLLSADYPEYMQKKLVILLLSVVIIAPAVLVFYLTRPAVAFISAELPEGFSLSGPSLLSSSFRLSGRAGSADLVIVMPSEAVPDSSGRTVLIGRSAEEGESPDSVIVPDLSSMWKTALSGQRECLLYESSDSTAAAIAAALLSSDDNAFEVTYSGRVSVANADAVSQGIGDADVIFYLTPSSSLRILRSSLVPAVLDSVHGAALETTAVSGLVGIDWDSTVEGLLSGSDALSYRFFPTKD